MTEGKILYFQQEDNLSGKAIYRMRIRNASPDRMVFDTENIGAVGYLLMPVFRPGGMQSITFLDRESLDVWRYYSIMRTSKKWHLAVIWWAFRRTRSLPRRHKPIA